MQSLELDKIKPTRQGRALSFLVARGVKLSEVAARLDPPVHSSYVGQILAGKKRPARYIRQLVAMGMPEHLLPEPYEGKCGRKPFDDDKKSAREAA